jgi:hypothetical protein
MQLIERLGGSRDRYTARASRIDIGNCSQLSDD